MLKIISQILNIFALITYILGAQIKDKNKVLLMYNIGNICYAVAFVLQDSYSGFASLIFAIVQNIYYVQRDKKERQPDIIELLIFFIIAGIISYYSYTILADILVICTIFINAFSVWQKNLVVFRIGMVTYSIFMIVYNILILNYTGVPVEIILFLSEVVGLIGLIRYNKHNKGEKELQAKNS